MHYNVFAGLNLVGVNANSFKAYSYIFRAGLSDSNRQALKDQYQLVKEIMVLNEKETEFKDRKNITADEALTRAASKISDAKAIAYIDANLSDPTIQEVANTIAEIANESVSEQIPHTDDPSTI